jgi:Methylase involved in ubiquinone/menaquinone biosynthesis
LKSHETYMLGYSANASDFMSRRTVHSHAAFLLPRLRPGLRVLDCGCGPGSITVGLAALVAPAEVVGLDREDSQLALARQRAAAQNISNVRFESGSIYELPFADASYDLVFAHAVFEHLREPLAALSEVHRVLRSGGMVALRSPDWGGFLIAPSSALLDEAIDYFKSLQLQSGGDVYVGRKFRSLLRQAHFRDIEFSASYECFRPVELVGEFLASRIQEAAQHLSSIEARQRVEGFAAALREWYRHEDGVFAAAWCEVIGGK